MNASDERRSRRGLLLTVAGVFLLAVGIGILGYWAWPEISWQAGLVGESWPYASKIAPEDARPTDTPTPKGNRIVIPRIAVDQQVFGAGSDISIALKRGVYHHPETAEPGEGDVVVIAGHRNRRQFALLHRLQPGDPILVYWNGEEHIYRVERTYVTTPDDDSVLAASGEEELRLYTCRPRVFDDSRTVLLAVPD